MKAPGPVPLPYVGFVGRCSSISNNLAVHASGRLPYRKNRRAAIQESYKSRSLFLLPGQSDFAGVQLIEKILIR